MKKEKKQKGITLVALIITIIILLTLSVVTIRTITENGIIAHAKNAKAQYEQKAAEENTLLSNLTGYITGQVGGSKPSGPALSEIKIGDKVAYDEGYRVDKKSDVDTNFQMDDMEWRVLDVEANGTVKLISTKPTTSKLTLSGEEGWINGPTKLDKLCSDLYANGTGVTARSLKAEDINKLANYDPTTYSGYGDKYQYRYSTEVGYMQYRKSTDDGITWTDYTNTDYSDFKEPGKDIIDKDHTTRIAELTDDYYNYVISSKITEKTEDNILISYLIGKGLNEDNNAANDSNIIQWLASRSIICNSDKVYYNVNVIYNNNINVRRSAIDTVGHGCVWAYNGFSTSQSYAVRPVIELSSNRFGAEKVNGVWQVNI